MNEFAISWLRGSDYAEVTAPNASAIKNKIVKWAKKGKPGVQIMFENKDGSIVAHIPVSFVQIREKKASISLTKEQRAERAKRLRDYRERKAAAGAETMDDVLLLGLVDIEDDDDELEDDNDSEFYAD